MRPWAYNLNEQVRVIDGLDEVGGLGFSGGENL